MSRAAVRSVGVGRRGIVRREVGRNDVGPTGEGPTGVRPTRVGRRGVGPRSPAPAGWRSLATAEAVVRLGVLAFAAFPLASFLFRAVPFAPAMGFAGIAALVAIDGAIVALAARARRHPLSPLVWIMAATIVVLVVDIATGARLQSASILGYSPHTAGRFYGLGNSAFATLAATTMLVAALHVERAPRRREALAAVAALFAVVIVADAAPSLGDDVGGILTLGPVLALTFVALSGRRITWKALVGAAALTVVVLGVAAGIDLLRPPDARTHLGRLVADTLNGQGGLVDTIARKADANLQVIRGSLWVWVVPVVTAFVLGLLVWQMRLDELLPARSPRRIGVVAAVAAGVLGCVVNDSGIVVTAVVLVFVAPFLTLLALAGDGRTRGRPLLLEPALDLDVSRPDGSPGHGRPMQGAR